MLNSPLTLIPKKLSLYEFTVFLSLNNYKDISNCTKELVNVEKKPSELQKPIRANIIRREIDIPLMILNLN